MAETQKSGAVGRGGGDEEGASRPGGSARERDARTARIMSGGAGAHEAAQARANPGASDGAEDGAAAAGDGRRRSARVRAAVNACAGNQATTDAQILAAGAGAGDDAGEATGAGADGSGGGEGAGVGDAAGIACAGNQATTDAQSLAAGACGGDDAGEAAGAGGSGEGEGGEGEGASAGDAAGEAGVLVASVAVSSGARAARHAQSDSDAVVAAVMAEIGDELQEMMAMENQPDAPEWAMLCESLPALPEPADGMVRHGAAGTSKGCRTRLSGRQRFSAASRPPARSSRRSRPERSYGCKTLVAFFASPQSWQQAALPAHSRYVDPDARRMRDVNNLVARTIIMPTGRR